MKLSGYISALKQLSTVLLLGGGSGESVLQSAQIPCSHGPWFYICLGLPRTISLLERFLDTHTSSTIIQPDFGEPDFGKQTPMVTIPAIISLTYGKP